MKCNIYLKIGEESIPIALGLDSSLIPSEINLEFINIFKSYGNMLLLSEKLTNRLLEGISEKQISGEDKTNFGKYQIANSSAKELFEAASPQIKALFPDIDLSKIKVRLVEKFETYGNKIIVKLSTNGEDIYLLDGNPSTIRKFARHLAIENAVNNLILDKLAEDSKEANIIDLVLKEASKKFKEVTNRASLLRHFIKNKSNYTKINVNLGENTYTAQTLLNQIMPKIEHIYYPRNNKYSSPIVKNIYESMRFNDGVPSISYSDLYSILSGQTKISMFKSLLDFNKLMNSSEKTDDVLKFFKELGMDISEDNEEDNYSLLFSYIFKTERGFPYKYRRTSSEGKLLFNTTYYKLDETYDITYDTILGMTPYTYKNWRILEHELPLEKGETIPKLEYFISLYEIQPSTKGLKYYTLEETKLAIDDRLKNLTFKSSFMLELYQNFSEIHDFGTIYISKDFDSLLKGNVISILNILLPENILFLNPKEAIIKGNYNIEDFKSLIKEWPDETKNLLLNNNNLIPEINDISKAGVFLTLLNSKYLNQTRTPKIVNDIINLIKNASKKYFYVESIEPVYKDKKVIRKKLKISKLKSSPTNDIEYKLEKGFLYPVIQLWEETAELLNNLFGTNINILTQSEIKDKFGEKYSSEKAFIKGESVYINSTLGSTEDLLHEYIHIIMGYLKVNNPNVYEKLLKEVWNFTKDKNIIIRDYKDDSFITRLEENFVRKFAEYIFNRGDKKFNEIFNAEPIEEAFSTIFDKADINLKEAGKHPISEIFGRFSSEISRALSNNNKLFNGFASSENFKLTNQKSNLLGKWIESGKIKEYNCK